MFDFCQMDQRRRRDALEKIIKFWTFKKINQIYNSREEFYSEGFVWFLGVVTLRRKSVWRQEKLRQFQA